MNHSLMTADGNTHLKIFALALIAAIVVVVVGSSAHIDDPRAVRNGPAIKAGMPTQFTTRSGIEFR
jgi:hypothetical protein